MSKKFLTHLALFALGMALLGVIVSQGGRESLELFKQTRLIPLSGALLMTFGVMETFALKWGILVNTLRGERVATWWEYYTCLLFNRALGLILPKDITDLSGRAFWLTRVRGVPLSAASLSIGFDRLFELVFIGIAMLGVLPYWLGYVSAPIGIGIQALTIVCIGGLFYQFHVPLFQQSERFFHRGASLLARLPLFKKYDMRMVRFSHIPRNVLLYVYLLNITKLGCVIIRSYLFAVALGLPISPMIIFLGTPPAQLAFIFAFTPGGLGIFEAGWFMILKLSGIASESAATFVLAERLLTTLLIVALTALTYIAHKMVAFGQFFMHKEMRDD